MLQVVRPLIPGTVKFWVSIWHKTRSPWPPEDNARIKEELASTIAAVVGVDKTLFVGRGARRNAGRKGTGSTLHAAVPPTAEQHAAAERAAQDLLAEVDAQPLPFFPQPHPNPASLGASLWYCTTMPFRHTSIRHCNVAQFVQ